MATELNQPNIGPYWHTSKFVSPNTAAILYNLLRENIIWKRFAPSPKSRWVDRWSLKGGTNSAELDFLIECIMAQIHESWPVIIDPDAVFLNYYKDGNDYCPYHRDTYSAHIFTVSLGTTRDILIKANGPGRADKITLESGDLYFMSHQMQADYQHMIPKRKNVSGGRISLVFFARTR